MAAFTLYDHLDCIFFSKQSLRFLPFSLVSFYLRFMLSEVQECGTGIRHNDMDQIFHCSLHIAHFHSPSHSVVLIHRIYGQKA